MEKAVGAAAGVAAAGEAVTAVAGAAAMVKVVMAEVDMEEERVVI